MQTPMLQVNSALGMLHDHPMGVQPPANSLRGQSASTQSGQVQVRGVNFGSRQVALRHVVLGSKLTQPPGLPQVYKHSVPVCMMA